MQLEQILCKIKQTNPENLPGFEAQAKFSPPLRQKYTLAQLKNYKAKESAVLILLYEKEGETYIVFTQRHEYNGAHSGQISFPGGKKEQEDNSLMYTALREAKEEVGVEIQSENVLLPLTWLYVPPSNFIIYPFVAAIDYVPSFVPQESEVKEILEIKVTDLLNAENQQEFLYQNKERGIEFSSPSFVVKSKTIWGATAMILSEFLTILEK